MSKKKPTEAESLRTKFPGHFPVPEDGYEALWSSATIVPDTNVFLVLHEYAEPVLKEWQTALHKYRGQLWIPHQVAKEYFANRLKIISTNHSKYSAVCDTINSLLEELANPDRHPFLSEDPLSDLQQAIGNVLADLKERQTAVASQVREDPIRDWISDLLLDRVGQAPDDDLYASQLEEATRRMINKHPPGYKDGHKPEPDRYGDCILWLQVLEHAKSVSKPTILITSDQKEDWWQTSCGTTLGPRPELCAEHLFYTGHQLLMYSSHRFLQYVQHGSQQGTESEAVQETRNAMTALMQHLDFDPELMTTDLGESLPMPREAESIFKYIARNLADLPDRMLEALEHGVMPKSDRVRLVYRRLRSHRRWSMTLWSYESMSPILRKHFADHLRELFSDNEARTIIAVIQFGIARVRAGRDAIDG